MAPNKTTKPKITKPAPTKPAIQTIEKYLELVIIGIQETGITLNYAALGRYYGITAHAAELRFYRARTYVKKAIEAAEDKDANPVKNEDCD